MLSDSTSAYLNTYLNANTAGNTAVSRKQHWAVAKTTTGKTADTPSTGTIRKGRLSKLSTKNVWQRREFELQGGELKYTASGSRQKTLQLQKYSSAWSEGCFINLGRQADSRRIKLKARSEEQAAEWVGDMVTFLGDIVVQDICPQEQIEHDDAGLERHTGYSDDDTDAKIDMLAELKQKDKLFEGHAATARGRISAHKEDDQQDQQQAQRAQRRAFRQWKRGAAAGDEEETCSTSPALADVAQSQSAANFLATRTEGKWIDVMLPQCEVDLSMYATDDEVEWSEGS